MLTKYILQIGSEEYELSKDDLKNWSEVKCVYKRAEYGGIVRSFTSKFDFVNKAYRMLLSEFDKKGFNAKATLSLYIIDNNWNYNLEYSCDLDFASMTYTEHVLSINAIDDSVEGIIKANRSTKYEFIVGEDIPINQTKFLYDRIKLLETATYAISEGESESDGSLLGEYTPDKNYRLYVGLTNSELSIGGGTYLNDSQANGDGYMFSSMKSLEITLEYSISVALEVGCAALVLMLNDIPIKELHRAVNGKSPFLGFDQPSIDAVKNYIESDYDLKHRWATESWDGVWVTVKGIVWVVETVPMVNTNQWVSTGKTREEYCTKEEHDTITFKTRPGDKVWLKYDSDKNSAYKIINSSLKFSWESKGMPVVIDSINPGVLLEHLLVKMGVNYDSIILDPTGAIQDTLILPAECIRAIPGAKIQVSFKDFCDWFETVFGYIYVINEEYGIIEFKHRAELFSTEAEIIELNDAVGFEYSSDQSVIYSSIVAGYDKKDYDSVNGRDEFNFNSTYTTGYNVTEKKLELKSPFRADSYGLEFLVTKRNQETTDNSGDKDIFFVKGVRDGGYLKPNRVPVIQNSITSTLINGEFSPMHCIGANREYISIMAPSLVLNFASTEGNGSIVIDGIGMSDDLWLEDCEMLTAGQLKFTSGELNLPKDMNCLIRVKSNDYIYEGFIRQISFALERPEAVEYTIMIKTKTPCS